MSHRPTHARFSACSLVLLATAAGLLLGTAAPAQDTPKPADPVLADPVSADPVLPVPVLPVPEPGSQPATLRVAVLGGSVSGGLRWRDYEAYAPDPDPIAFAEKHYERPIDEREYELRTDNVSFADALTTLSRDTIQTVDLTQVQFHLAPESNLRTQLRRVPKGTNVLFSADLLFWFGYGPTARPPADLDPADHGLHDALERFEKQQVAFGLLNAFLRKRPHCTLVLGDYPRFKDPDRLLILPGFEPSELTLETLNERLRQWAARSEGQALVYSASRDVDLLSRNALQLELLDGAKQNVGCHEFLQLDGIHPNRLCMAQATRDVMTFFAEHLPKPLRTRVSTPPTFPTALTLLETSLADLQELARLNRERR